MRKTSKIISKTKYRLVTDGTKQPPMHAQLLDYIKHFNDKNEDYEKLMRQEYIRNRIKNMMPSKIRNSDEKLAIRTPPPPDYLANKHTYTSMRKISNMKSRKQFIFDDYDLEQRKK